METSAPLYMFVSDVSDYKYSFFMFIVVRHFFQEPSHLDVTQMH